MIATIIILFWECVKNLSKYIKKHNLPNYL
jgi:hypothetical protein